MNESDKLNSVVINFCPTGMVPTKKMNASVPISVSEIVEETQAAFEKGITIVHLHARNADETPTYKKNVYRDIFEGVRKHCSGLIVCGSSSGRNWPEFEKRSEVLELMPDMCSLTLSSLNFMHQASVNEPDMIVRLALKMKEYGVVPELECFDVGMINYGKYLMRKGVLEGPHYWNLLFGNIAGMQANLATLAAALQEIPHTDCVALAGLGQDQLKINALAISMGLGVRIGLEDNLWFDEKKTIPATNLMLLERVHRVMEIHEKQCMASEALGASGFYNKRNSILSALNN
jgi:uncharacterized protein (DUF849 family)